MEDKKTIVELAGLNIAALSITVKRSELERSDDSIYRSKCPVCKEGLLPVSRSPQTFKIVAEDRCMLCGQLVIYSDYDKIEKQ